MPRVVPVPVEPPRQRDWGFLAYDVSADFDEPLPALELAAWTGDATCPADRGPAGVDGVPSAT